MDSKVLLDIIKPDPYWLDWSRSALADALMDGMVCINPLLYAELSIMYQTSAQLDQMLNTLGIGRVDLWTDLLVSARIYNILAGVVIFVCGLVFLL